MLEEQRFGILEGNNSIDGILVPAPKQRVYQEAGAKNERHRFEVALAARVGLAKRLDFIEK